MHETTASVSWSGALSRVARRSSGLVSSVAKLSSRSSTSCSTTLFSAAAAAESPPPPRSKTDAVDACNSRLANVDESLCCFCSCWGWKSRLDAVSLIMNSLASSVLAWPLSSWSSWSSWSKSRRRGEDGADLYADDESSNWSLASAAPAADCCSSSSTGRQQAAAAAAAATS